MKKFILNIILLGTIFGIIPFIGAVIISKKPILIIPVIIFIMYSIIKEIK